MKPASAIMFIVILSGLPSAKAAWQKLPALEKRTIETAIQSIKGTKVVSSRGIGQADALISDDPTQAVTLSSGTSEAVLNLGGQRVIESAYFVNESIEGKIVVSGSGDMKNWTPLGQAIFTPADWHVDVNFAGTQIKYLKIQFELSKGGTIRNFMVFGGDTDQDYTLRQNESGQGGLKMNVANGMGGSRVIYIHPNPNKDSDVTEIGRAQAKFDFPESDEKYRTIIYDLGTPRVLSEFGSVHSPRPVRFEVFTFEQLPEKEDWRGRMSFDPKAFDSAKPVATKEDPQGLGYIKVKTQKPVRARYVALRWEPDFNPPAFSVGGVEIAGNGFEPPEGNNAGGGGGGGGTGSDGGTGGTAGPNDSTNYGGGMSPFGYGTGGYAGGGGSLPSSTDSSATGNATGSATGNATGSATGNATGSATGNATGNANGAPPQSP